LPGLSPEQRERYSRQLVLPSVGEEGQRRLREARVLLIGAGGLGSPAALYLAAAGVGTLGIVDFDVVELSNLQRQPLHYTRDVGRPKTASAADNLAALNPEIHIRLHPVHLSSANALEILREYDIIIDGSDNFPTRYLVNDACCFLGKPNIHGSVFQFKGMAAVFLPGQGCYRCLYPAPPPPERAPSCAEAGVLGIVPGLIGILQATEALKLILGLGRPLAGRLIYFDALKMQFWEVKTPRNPSCPVCGDEPTITELIDYEQFCGLGA